MSTGDSAPNGNGKAALLTTLLSGDKGMQLIALALITISGGLNFFETRVGNEFNAREVDRATAEIHELYPKLMQALNNQNEMMGNNTRQLNNQVEILARQQKALDILKAGQDRVFGGGTDHP